MNKAKFKVSNEFMADLLNLPKGAKVLYIVQHIEDAGRQFDVFVTHPDLPEVLEGQQAPEVQPWFRACDDGRIDFAQWGTDEAKAELMDANT